MKQEPIERTASVGRAEPRARIIQRAPRGPRPPVKRRLFAVGGASQPGRVRLTVGAVTSSSASTASPDLPAPGTDQAPLVLRTQQPHKTFQRLKRKTGSRYPPPAVWLKVGDREVLDFKISMGHQQEVMASELCDLDTKQTVLVRSTFDDPSLTNPTPSYNSLDCSGIDWQPSYSQCYTPPGHNTQTMPQFPMAPATPEQGGDYKRPVQCQASQPPPPAPAAPSQPCRPDGDASSLMWLLDYRLDHLLEPTQEEPSQAPVQPAVKVREEQPQDPLQLESTFAPCCQRGLESAPAVGREQFDRKCDHDFKTSQEMVKQQGYYATSTTKPPFTYTELIEQAMLEEGELTVSGIYKWITSHFGFYKSCDDRWKNSVRHNLSMNPYFRKGDKAKNGSGHLWMLANVEGRRVRRNNVAARMGRPSRKMSGEPEFDLCDDIPSPANDIWLSSAAENKENMPITGEYSIEYLNYVPDQMLTGQLLQAAPPTNFTLEESADRILNGTNNHVEVQFITPVRNDRIGQDVMLVDYQNLDVAMQS